MQSLDLEKKDMKVEGIVFRKRERNAGGGGGREGDNRQ
jgi:hypothetical protein